MPVHGYTEFRHLVHLKGANLNFYQLVIHAEDGRVQCSIAVGFGIGDKVFDTALFGLPQAMHMPKGKIAIRS